MNTDNTALYAFRKFGHLVLRTACCYVGNYSEAKDITHDVFLALHEKKCETPDMVGDLPYDDFIYTQKVTLKKTENGWRFSEYTPYKLVVGKFQETLYEQQKELNCQ